MTGGARPAIARAGVVLAVLQFAFALTWIVYAAFLPALAAQVGIARSVVPWILLADQAIFMVCDWLAGVFADRVGNAGARLARPLAGVALVSCAAFLALPLVAPAGSAPVLAVVVAVWSASSSMLRAPPLALAGRHAPRPQRAWLAGAYSLGLAAAGAVAPYLGRAMVGVDPRIPFAATSVVVAAMVLVATALRPIPPQGAATRDRPAGAGAPGSLAGLVAAVAVLAIGLQVHTSITSAAIYLRFAAPEALTDLQPVFWYGCALAALPAAPLVRRLGGLAVMAGAAAAGAAALAAAALAGSLAAVIAAQAAAGLAWGATLSGAFAAASSIEHRPGAATGLVFSVLAAATVARIALVASGTAAGSVAAVLPAVPPIAWAAGALIAGALAVRR